VRLRDFGLLRWLDLIVAGFMAMRGKVLWAPCPGSSRFRLLSHLDDLQLYARFVYGVMTR
jgi:hypothetical protein